MRLHKNRTHATSTITTPWRMTAAACAVLFIGSSPIGAAFAGPSFDLLDLQVFAKQSISAERSDYEGPAAAGGSIALSDFRVDGDLTAGSRISFERGQVSGFVRSPDIRMSRVFSSGVGPMQDNRFDVTSLKLDLLGARLAALSPTSRMTVGTGLDGKTEFTASARRALEVVDVTGDRLNAAGDARTRLVLTGDTRTQLLVRVHGQSVQMRHLAFTVTGGLDPSRIVLFFPEATDLEIAFSGGAEQDGGQTWNIPGSIVAPNAALRFAASTITGQVFARSIASIQGLPGGQVDRLPASAGPTGQFTPSRLLQSIGNDQVAAWSSPLDDVTDQPTNAPDHAGCQLICTRGAAAR